MEDPREHPEVVVTPYAGAVVAEDEGHSVVVEHAPLALEVGA